MREFVFAGLLITPVVKYGLIALVLYAPIHLLLVRARIRRWAWHPLLAEASLYLCLLAVLNILGD